MSLISFETSFVTPLWGFPSRIHEDDAHIRVLGHRFPQCLGHTVNTPPLLSDMPDHNKIRSTSYATARLDKFRCWRCT